MNALDRENRVIDILRICNRPLFITSFSVVTSAILTYAIQVTFSVGNIAAGQVISFLASFSISLPLSGVVRIYLKILKKKNSQLAELAEMRSTLLSVVSHDLKNPISALSDGVSMLIEDYAEELDDDFKSILEIAQVSALESMSLIDSILQWSKTKHGAMVANKELTDINKIATEVVNLLHPLSHRKKIDLQNKIPEQLEVLIDAKIIATVLRNLVTNSIKFTEQEGRVAIKVSIHKDFYRVHVEDNGVGMSDEALTQLLQKYSLDSQQGTNQESGYGIGLELCFAFLEVHGTALKVESSLNNGSDFYFDLAKN